MTSTNHAPRGSHWMGPPPSSSRTAQRALLFAAGLSLVGCVHDVTASAATDAPVLVGPVHQIASETPAQASPLSPFNARLFNVRVSTGDEPTENFQINNQHQLDNAVVQATGNEADTFVALRGAQVKAMLFVVGWVFDRTNLNLYGTTSRRSTPAPSSPESNGTADPMTETPKAPTTPATTEVP